MYQRICLMYWIQRNIIDNFSDKYLFGLKNYYYAGGMPAVVDSFRTEKATFEQDFLIQKGKSIVPIEVKAESNIRSQSLKAFCKKYKPDYAVRFSAKNIWNKNG